MRDKKVVAVAGILLLSLAVWVFWHPLTHAVVKHCIDVYCQKNFGGSVVFDEMKREHGSFVLMNPALVHKGAKLSADKALVSIRVAPFKGVIDLKLDVSGSVVHLEDEISSLEETVYEIISKGAPSPFFEVRFLCTIHGGTVLWRQAKSNDTKRHQADFDFVASGDKNGKNASLNLFLDGRQTSENTFEASFKKEKRLPFCLELSWNKVQCKEMARIYQALGHSFHGWQVFSGNFDGTIHYLKSENSVPYVWGEVVVEDLAFGNPSLEIQGVVKQAKSDLQAVCGEGKAPRITGTISLAKEAGVEIKKKGVVQWKLEDFLGDILFLPGDNIQLSSRGRCSHHDHQFGLAIDGEAQLKGSTAYTATAACYLSNAGKEDAQLTASLHRNPDAVVSLEAALAGFGKEEFELVQSALAPYIPRLGDIKMASGTAELKGKATLVGSRIERVVISDAVLKDVVCLYSPLDMTVHTHEAVGSCSFVPQSEDPLSSINAHLRLADGSLDVWGVNGSLWKFQELSTEVFVKDGRFQRSLVKGSFCGLDGTIVVDWESPKEFLTFDFQGEAANAAQFLPSSLANNLHLNHKEEAVKLAGSIGWSRRGATIQGNVACKPRSELAELLFQFGFDIEKSSEKLWKRWPADQFAISYWQGAGLEALQKVIPPIAFPFVLMESRWIKAESGIAGLVLRNGWFRAENLPLERVLAPFLFPKQEMALTGTGTFRGVFDHSSVVVEYSAKDVHLESDFLSMHVDAIPGRLKGPHQASFYAAHYFDFERGDHFGTIPLIGAVYREKTTGLAFENVNATVVFENGEIHFSDISSQLQGLQLVAGVDVDLKNSSEGVCSVDCAIDRFEGKISQVLQVISQSIGDASFFHLPLEGDICLTEPGALFSLRCTPDQMELHGKIAGLVSNGSCSFPEWGLTVKGMKFNFGYDYDSRSLTMENIHADIFLGEENGPQRCLSLTGEYIRFTDFSRGMAEFDMWIGDSSRDILRLVGSSQGVKDEESESQHIVCTINHAFSHFRDIHPSSFQLVLKDWLHVESFECAMDARLDTLWQEAVLLQRTGLFPLPSQWLKKAGEEGLAVDGKANISLCYQEKDHTFSWKMTGKEIACSDYTLDRIEFVGRKCGYYWCIDSLEADHFFLTGYFKKTGEGFRLSQIKAAFKDTLAVEFSGDYLLKDQLLKLHLYNVELDFNRTRGLSKTWEYFFSGLSPEGIMSGSGDVELAAASDGQTVRAEALLDVSFKNWAMMGLHFQDVHNVSCHFNADKGLTIRNLSSSVVTPDTKLSRAQFAFEKAFLEFSTQNVIFDSLKFQVPVHHLPWMADRLAASFPGFFSPSVCEVMKNCKMQGCLEGVLHYENSPPFTGMRLSLKDGKYYFLSSEHDVKDFVMEYDPYEFKLESAYLLGNQYVRLLARSTCPWLSKGELYLVDHGSDSRFLPKGQKSLYALWENDEKWGLSVVRAEGELYGLYIDVKRDPLEPLSEEAFYLTGDVFIDGRGSMPLFPEEIASKVQEWQIGEGYRLSGKWRWQKGKSGGYADKLHFCGLLEGENFKIKGYQLDSLSASVEYTPKYVRVRDLTVNDEAGKLSAGKIDMMRGTDENWYFSCPLVHVEKFKPYHLQEEGFLRPQIKKPLIFQRLDLQSCQGKLSDSQTVIGQGSLRFTNRSKRRLQNTIFHVPSELLSKIGLDLSVLTPVTGSIEYKIHDGNVYLTKFKDIYSESKLSRFYLSSNYPSKIDFEGNCDLQVRMKQNNLLFKLAELFTVNIGGTLQKPAYSLQKQREEQ